LQNQGCCDLVDDFVMLLARMSCFIQNLVSLMRGEALIEKVNRQLAQFCQLCGELLRPPGLWARISREVQGVPHNDARDAKAAREPNKGAQIVSRYAGRGTATLERQ
jgi:hypothetical protein